jgi:hypothetical protein
MGDVEKAKADAQVALQKGTPVSDSYRALIKL